MDLPFVEEACRRIDQSVKAIETCRLLRILFPLVFGVRFNLESWNDQIQQLSAVKNLVGDLPQVLKVQVPMAICRHR